VDLASVSGILATVSSFTLAIVILLFTERKFRKYDALVNSVSDLLRYETDSEGNVSLDARVTGMVSALSSGIAKSIKMSFLQGLSVDSKLQNGLKSAMVSDAVDNQFPMLNLVGDFLGINTKKYLTKHPQALMQLAPMLQGFMQKNPNNSGGKAGYG
jgi:hypothetical protein